MSTLSLLKRGSRLSRGRPLALSDEYEISYDEALSTCVRLASKLGQLGGQPGSLAAILSPNDPRVLSCSLGIQAAGMVSVPLNRQLPSPDLADALCRFDCDFVFYHSRDSELLASALELV